MRWRGSADPDKGESTISHDSRFEWRFRGERFALDATVPAYLYQYYDDRAVTECVVRFVQSIPYEQDIVTTGKPEYPQFPVETLYYEQGDCEDLSILLGALLRELGHDVAVLVLPNHSHMCVGVDTAWAEGGHITHDGTAYHLIESTNPGWGVGEVAPEYAGAPIRAHPVDSVPLLLHQWEAAENGDGTVELEGSLVNYGTGCAETVSVVAWFEGPDGQTGRTTPLETEDEVLPRTSASFAGRVPLPRAGRLRAHVQLRVGGRVHDQTTSAWE